MDEHQLKLILLPGMDGTGELFTGLLKKLPKAFEAEVVRYPTDRNLSYSQLKELVESVTLVSDPFVLIAESFSAPLAIQSAAANPPNLKGLVICAGFVTSPVKGILRFIYSLLAPIFFRVPLPGFAVRLLLLGPRAQSSLLAAVQAAISSVKPSVLSTRARAVLACDARAELAQITAPILYIQAQEDRLIDKLCLEEIRRTKPQTVVRVIPGPHLLFQQEPQRTADVIQEFVQQLV
jgi:pimeloyl-[acyl-carrier protein] methyl ester esterase